MGLISRLKTWASADVLTANDLNGEIDGIITQVNGNLDANNIKDDYPEGRILFSDVAGHAHTGAGNDGKRISTPATSALFGMVLVESGTTGVIAAVGHEDIVFAAPFTAIPIIQVCAQNDPDPEGYEYRIFSDGLTIGGNIVQLDVFLSNITLDGFTINHRAPDADTITCKWTAIGI